VDGCDEIYAGAETRLARVTAPESRPEPGIETAPMEK
jgi:hypothetical protein